MQPIKLFIPEEVSETKFISMINPLILEEESILKHLYVKQHSVTKLLYFGMTESEDPIKYPGSGKHWNKHLKKHGKEFVNTLCVWIFNCQSECTVFALKFSEDNNIIKSKAWANEILENALTGTPRGHRFSEEAKKNMTIAARKRCKNMTSKQKEIVGQRVSVAYQNKTTEEKTIIHKNQSEGHQNRSSEQKEIVSQNISAAHKNKSLEQKERECHNKRVIMLEVHQNKSPEQREKERDTMRAAAKGRLLYDKAGKKSKFFKEQPDDPTWILRLPKRKRKE